MDYNMVTGGYGMGMMFFAWILYTATLILIILGIVALLKYINKK